MKCFPAVVLVCGRKDPTSSFVFLLGLIFFFLSTTTKTSSGFVVQGNDPSSCAVCWKPQQQRLCTNYKRERGFTATTSTTTTRGSPLKSSSILWSDDVYFLPDLTISALLSVGSLNYATELFLNTKTAAAEAAAAVQRRLRDDDELQSSVAAQNDDDDDDDKNIQNTIAYQIANSLTRTAQVFAFLRVVVAVVQQYDPNLFPAVAEMERGTILRITAAAGIALVLSALKRSYFSSITTTDDPDNLGRVSLFDTLIDAVLFFEVVSLLVDTLQIDIGMGLQSLFAAGGLGAVFFTLATKEIAEQVVGGFVINGSDIFEVGDTIIVGGNGDGGALEGKVTRIGLIETDICGYDNVITTVPNAFLVSQQISNLSLVHVSQVKQTLRFRYSDVDKLAAVIESIKEEIASACSTNGLITDGRRPFRAHWYNYKEDHIEVQVNCHFDVKPGSEEYMTARQNMLEAIAVAVRKNGVEFAIPSIIYLGRDNGDTDAAATAAAAAAATSTPQSRKG